jgi:hypothetical protein
MASKKKKQAKQCTFADMREGRRLDVGETVRRVSYNKMASTGRIVDLSLGGRAEIVPPYQHAFTLRGVVRI